MTPSIALVLGLLVFIIAAFATEKMPPDLLAVVSLVVLMLARVLDPVEALHGFTGRVILLLVGIFVISSALVRTGVAEAAGRGVNKVMGRNPHGILAGLTTTVATVSAFMNNTAVTAIFIPPAIGVARRLRISTSKFLIPVAYASLLGGTCTLIGTSTNVAASGFLESKGMAPLGMFELAPVGIVCCVFGIAYLSTVAWWILPERATEAVEDAYRIRAFLSEVVVPPNSPLAGRTLAESGIGTELGLSVLAIHREGSAPIVSPGSHEQLRQNDLLIVQGKAEEILRVKSAPGIEMRTDLHPSAQDLTSEDVRLIEMIPTPQSDLLGQTLKEINFRGRYGVTAIGLYRAEESEADKIGKLPLKLGDVLLVQGRKEAIERMSHLPELEMLGSETHFTFDRWRSAASVILFAAGIIAGSTGLTDLSVAILAAALGTVLIGAVPWNDVYRLIPWRLLILIGGMTSFGLAMTKTGTDRFLAGLVIDLFGPFGSVALLAGFFLLTVLLTQPMANASACLVVLPVAISTAQSLGVNPRAFAITVTIAASCAFLAPLEPSCLMVYGPGRYKFRDFTICGAPLTAIVMMVTLVIVPRLWPL